MMLTFAILTTKANETVRGIGDRMPVVLEPADWPLWLAETEGDPLNLLRPAGEDILYAWRVAARRDRLQDQRSRTARSRRGGGRPAPGLNRVRRAARQFCQGRDFPDHAHARYHGRVHTQRRPDRCILRSARVAEPPSFAAI